MVFFLSFFLVPCTRQEGEFKLTDESVLPVTEKESKERGKGASALG